MAKFLQIPASLHTLADKQLVSLMEPIRDMVRRRFQGDISDERVVTRADLVALGLATQAQVNELENE